MTYAELVQKIRDYTEVDSGVLTSTIVNGFIRDSELRYLEKQMLTTRASTRHLPLPLIINMCYYLTLLVHLVQQLQEEH
jgi:hypothetical protein